MKGLGFNGTKRGYMKSKIDENRNSKRLWETSLILYIQKFKIIKYPTETLKSLGCGNKSKSSANTTNAIWW